MQNEIKNKIITIGFVVILFGIFLLNIIVKDKEISTTERRKLAQLPKVSISKILNGNVMSDFDKYVTDQFIQRDLFRSIKSIWSINIFRHKDNNNLFVIDNSIYKIEYPLNEKNVTKSANKIKEVCEKYLQGMNVNYAIIPDKNYYLQNDEHLKMDYNKLKEIMSETLIEAKYIDIWEELKLEDYYKTDLHWKQENIQDVVAKLQKDIKLEETSHINYEIQNKGEFFGTYYGQLGLNLPSDNLNVLTNEIIENCTTYNYEKQKEGKIYEQTNSADKYDIYLSGATALISIENPNAKTDKELLLFRDSFGSSIAPLLVENYQKITLIDLRYISSKLLGDYINFEEQDVLFLYSTVILNQNVFK